MMHEWCPTIRYGEWPHPSVKSTNVVKLPNPHNSIHNALRSASPNPERGKSLEAQKLTEWAVKRANCIKASNSSVGHSAYRLLRAVLTT